MHSIERSRKRYPLFLFLSAKIVLIIKHLTISMPSILYYLGPEHTWSHAAALRATRTVTAVEGATLLPLASADLLFKQIESEPNVAVIIPHLQP